jgi:hypothetical protein
MVIGGK